MHTCIIHTHFSVICSILSGNSVYSTWQAWEGFWSLNYKELVALAQQGHHSCTVCYWNRQQLLSRHLEFNGLWCSTNIWIMKSNKWYMLYCSMCKYMHANKSHRERHFLLCGQQTTHEVIILIHCKLICCLSGRRIDVRVRLYLYRVICVQRNPFQTVNIDVATILSLKHTSTDWKNKCGQKAH